MVNRRLVVSKIGNCPLIAFSKLGFFLGFFFFDMSTQERGGGLKLQYHILIYDTKMGKFINGLTPYEIIIIFTYKLFLIKLII
jgi:hypothetical protein